MRKNGHENLAVKNCGFIIHPTQCWLGASPDGLVHDPASHDPSGIKCPNTKRNVTPEEACQDRDFYRTLEDGRPHLLPPSSCSDFCSWCDFCVLTTKGCMVCRFRVVKRVHS